MDAFILLQIYKNIFEQDLYKGKINYYDFKYFKTKLNLFKI